MLCEAFQIFDSSLQAMLEEFRRAFAWNNHRRGLFEVYLDFLEEFKNLAPGRFYQFINGSYVSKKEFPKDIDLVTFVNFERALKLGSRLEYLEKLFFPNLDIRFARFYPENHPLRNITSIFEDDCHQVAEPDLDFRRQAVAV